MPSKPQHSPHRHCEITYSAKQQLVPDEDTSPTLDISGIRRIQGIVGALLYYGWLVDNKILVALSDIGTQQSKATESTSAAINQLLDYVATYKTDSITYRASNIRLAAHSYAAYLNISKAWSLYGSHIFLSEDEPKPRHNGPILTIAQIIIKFMSSATEAELAALFITAKYMVPLCQTLIEIKWPQGQSPTQTKNPTALGFTNNTILPNCTK